MRLFQVAVVVLLGLHLWQGLVHGADPDEYQALVNATLVSRGLSLYADFWDNHGPLTTWVLAPVLSLWTGGHGLLLWLRAGEFGITAATALLVFGAIRIVIRDRQSAWAGLSPWVGMTIMLSAPPFIAKSIEVRPDNLANLCATGALVLIIRGLRSDSRRAFLGAGLAVGLMAGVTLKVAVFVIGLSTFFIGYSLAAKSRPRLAQLLLFTAGVFLVITAMAGVMAWLGTVRDFLNCYLWENVSREFSGFTSSRLTQITKKAPFWSLWALWVLGWGMWRIAKRTARPVEAGLTLLVLAVILQFAIVMPTQYYQSLLVAFPPLGILTGIWSMEVLPRCANRRGEVIVGTLILLAAMLVRDMHAFANLANRSLQKEITFADATLHLLDTDDRIFDPTGTVYLARRSGYYPVLVKFVRRRYATGNMDAGVKAQLEQVRGVVMDQRTLNLPPADLDFIRENFHPALLGPGTELWTRK